MTMKELAERPLTRSLTEEVVGILWAMLACVSPHKVVTIFAVLMAAVSFGGAIYFAIMSRRASQEPTQ